MVLPRNLKLSLVYRSKMEDTLALFQSIGLSEAKAKDTVKNAAVSNSLRALILEVFEGVKEC